VKLRRLNPTTASDYRRMIALWEAAGLTHKPRGRDAQEAIERQLAGGTHTFIGAETEAGELVGTVLATHDGRRGWLNRLAVHPDYRRQGIAKALIEAAEEALREQGMRIISAMIEPDNEASLALLLSSGYIEWPGLHYVSKRDHQDV
jgi:ribosomal protein S18 acetylase RimI-like enzyme